MEPVSLPEGFTRWNIVIATGMTMTTLMIVFWQAYGFSEAGLLETLNASGQLAFLFFLVSFLAWPLYKSLPSPFTYWMLSNQYYVGLSLIIIYTSHAIACIGLKWGTEYWDYQEWQLGWKMIAYALLGLTTVNPLRSWKGNISIRKWYILQTLSMYGIWGIFQLELLAKAQQVGDWYQWSLVLLALAALIIRVGDWSKPRSRLTRSLRLRATSNQQFPRAIYSELPFGQGDRSDLDITIAKRIHRRPDQDGNPQY